MITSLPLTQAAMILSKVGLSATPILGMTMGMVTAPDVVQPRTLLGTDSVTHRWSTRRVLADLVQGNGNSISIGDWQVVGRNHDATSIEAVRPFEVPGLSRLTKLDMRWHAFWEGYRLREMGFSNSQGVAEILHSVSLREHRGSLNTIHLRWDDAFAAHHNPVQFVNDETGRVEGFPSDLLPYLGLIRFLGLCSSMTREILEEMGEHFPDTRVFLELLKEGNQRIEIPFHLDNGLGHRFEIHFPEAPKTFRRFFVYVGPGGILVSLSKIIFGSEEQDIRLTFPRGDLLRFSTSFKGYKGSHFTLSYVAAQADPRVAMIDDDDFDTPQSPDQFFRLRSGGHFMWQEVLSLGREREFLSGTRTWYNAIATYLNGAETPV